MPSESFQIPPEQSNQTLAAILRSRLPGKSWNDLRKFIAARHVKISGDLCLDPARRVREGDQIEILTASAPKPRQPDLVKIRYLDEHLVVVEKPSGMPTVRHPLERTWTQRRRDLSPTLEDIVRKLIAAKKEASGVRGQGSEQKGTKSQKGLPALRKVHRLDKETSGLVVFARTVTAERGLGRQFHKHTVIRRYLAVIPGYLPAQRIATRLIRDRGDGRRGSTAVPGRGKEAITHVEVEERLPNYTVLSCRLETGRTHQIRIHLAEQGHPVCGEKVYNRKPHQEPRIDASGAPRLALHAVELGFVHPITREALHWTMPLPDDLQAFVDRLRGASF
jgi:23S rRNA pseudouridine1911/1915/1917 synthase